MAKDEKTRIIEARLPIQMQSHMPDLSVLSGLGFDSLSIKGNDFCAKKVHGTDMHGKAAFFSEVEIKGGEAILRYSCSGDSHRGVSRLQATLMFLRILRLLPGMACELSRLSSEILPALESSEKIASAPYSLVAKRLSDCRSDLAELSAKNRRFSRTSDELAAHCAELEGKISGFEASLKRYETVSDDALRELVLDWIISHRGRFNCSQFSRSSGIRPSRIEEGIEILLREGAIRKIPSGYSAANSDAPSRVFELEKPSVFGFVKKLFNGNADKAAGKHAPGS